MKLWRGAITIAAVAACVPVAASTALAAVATRPRVAARLFGEQPVERQHPDDFDLNAEDVVYTPGGSGWWLRSESGSEIGAVVIAHGFETSPDPKATDPAPRLLLASKLVARGFSCLVISLGYASGAHLHSGGELEADDIAAAVRFAQARTGKRVAIIGFSAGGHAAVASTNRCEPFAVLTDSAFVDFTEVLAEQGSSALGLPPRLFGLAPHIMGLMTGRIPVNLETIELGAVPMLHIHGDADSAIGYSELARIAEVTEGRTCTIAGADHNDSLRVQPDRYPQMVLEFLHDSLAMST